MIGHAPMLFENWIRTAPHADAPLWMKIFGTSALAVQLQQDE